MELSQTIHNLIIRKTAMKKSDRIALITLPIITLIGILVALAGSQGSIMAVSYTHLDVYKRQCRM